MSRKTIIIGPNTDRDIDLALRRRFLDLAQENFGIGPVHSSYYMMEPVIQPGWTVQLVIPILEDDDTPVVLFKAVLPPYEGLGAIYAPPVINKFILIMNTGLDIVCGPHDELCACYHNGLPLSDAQTDVSDLVDQMKPERLTSYSVQSNSQCSKFNHPKIDSVVDPSKRCKGPQDSN